MKNQSKGANSLRGGKRTYNPKTLLSHWVEMRYDPSIDCKKSFPSSNYESTSAAMGSDVLPTSQRNSVTKIGAAIATVASDEAYHNAINYQTSEKSSEWKTVTQSAYTEPKTAKKTEFCSTFVLRDHQLINDTNAMNDYRERWTKEKDSFRELRFQSEQTRAMSKAVGKEFITKQTRIMPGVPLAVEKVRNIVFQISGAHGIRNFQRIFLTIDDEESGVISTEELKWALTDFGVELTKDELSQFTDYFTAGPSKISYDRILTAFRGNFTTSRLDAVNQAYHTLTHAAATTKSDSTLLLLSVNDLCEVYDCSLLPDFKDGTKTRDEVISDFKKQLHPLTMLNQSDFIDYYRDLSASIYDDNFFVSMVKRSWGIVDQKKSYVRMMQVEVTHPNGSTTKCEIPESFGFRRSDYIQIENYVKEHFGYNDLLAVNVVDC